jgi:hypothetical protein
MDGSITSTSRFTAAAGTSYRRDVFQQHNGFWCWLNCRISGSEFKNNETGFYIGAETGATITDTTFTGNQRGGQVNGFDSRVQIERSTFSSNILGLFVTIPTGP